MIKPKIGIVIPIVQKKYITDLISQIYETVERNDIVLCVVNDGNTRIRKYLQKMIPKKVHLVNLDQNKCFAGANNVGWNYLMDNYPSLKYLGTINDDAIPSKGWLDEMITRLENNERLGACSPIMLSTDSKESDEIQKASTWKLNNFHQPMVLESREINQDQLVSVLGGFCLIGRKVAFLEVGLFDDRYQNSCEDIDLSLKLTDAGWKLMVCHNAFVYHKVGKSRFKFRAKTNIKLSRDLLRYKWGDDLTRYNLK